MVSSISRRALTKGMLAAGLLSALRAPAEQPAPEAITQQGRVRGFVRNGASVFLGLPYGADTSGERRFRAPQSPTAWQGVRDATKPGQRAPQVVGAPPPDFWNYFVGGRLDELVAMPQPVGEDCLVVNVVTPTVDRRRRPVLFYIHGGGFTVGSGLTMTFGERFVVREDIVLVTVNHRLGALGYMYLGDVASELAEGNPGMLDLVAALRWVRANIAAFGGDPEKVTIFGESGGGAKIGLLLAMPQAKGLFRAAVIQSGLLPEPLAPERATATTRAFMERVGAKDLAALQALPLERFVAVTSTNAARIFGLYPKKGVIREGADADVVIWDPERAGTIRAEDDRSKSDYSVYDGWPVRGWPTMTIRRGEVVADSSQVLGKAGSGRVTPRGVTSFPPLR